MACDALPARASTHLARLFATIRNLVICDAIMYITANGEAAVIGRAGHISAAGGRDRRRRDGDADAPKMCRERVSGGGRPAACGILASRRGATPQYLNASRKPEIGAGADSKG
jgi:hypothetical protein